MNVHYRVLTSLLFLSMISLPLASRAWGQQDSDTLLNEASDFRSIGPFRGGRSAAVTGVPGKPMLYYHGWVLWRLDWSG